MEEHKDEEHSTGGEGLLSLTLESQGHWLNQTLEDTESGKYRSLDKILYFNKLEITRNCTIMFLVRGETGIKIQLRLCKHSTSCRWRRSSPR